MNRIVLAGLALVLVRDCEIVAPGSSSRAIRGTWGGENAGLMADDTSAHVHIRCTFGNIHQAIALDAAGRFDVPGDYVLRAYPVYVGPTLPARFQGSVERRGTGGSGSTTSRVMTLTVIVSDTTADTTAQLGPVVLTFGKEPKMGPCPICRRPTGRAE
jgi:hypothetical protein